MKKYDISKDSTSWRVWIELKHKGFSERLACFLCDSKKEKRRQILFYEV